MSWSTDLQIVLRGLDKVARAAAGQQQRDLQRFWDNSSLKSATKAVNVQVEEKLSDIVINKDITILQEKLEKATTFSSNFVELMVEQSKAVYSNVKVSGLRDDLASATEDNVQSERTKSSTQIDEHFGMRPDITFDSATAPASSPDMGANTQEASQNQTVLDNAKKAYRPPDEINESRHHKPPRAPPRKPKLYGAKPLGRHSEQHLSDQAKERKVPGSRIGRVFSFGSLAVGLGAGAVAELTRRGLGLQKPKQDGPRAILDHSPFLTHANAERIVSTLCRVRGAALKLGQMISIQDNSLINPELQAIFERVRQSADFMPSWQMKKVLVQELGEDWRNKLEGFEEKPFAAASIGQVHAGTLLDGRQVAMKIQYPGVADSIDSDIDNLMTLLNTTRILPEGMHLDSTMRVARTELGWECDYIREAECSKRFRKLLEADPVLYVPDVIDDLTSRQVLTTELVNGLPLDKIDNIDQDIKDWIAENILRLCLTEVFEFRFMQTDPNWANFLYDAETGRITLLDFGASREYSRKFVDQYIRVIKAASLGDRKGVLLASQKLGFLTGYESKTMENAHIDAVLILGESFAEEGKFDFGGQNTAARIHNLVPVMLKHRLTAPPEETYSLHRKMAGCFLLCSKLKANIECKPLFDSIWASYRFETEDSDLEYLLTR